jgi:hypothetical protein
MYCLLDCVEDAGVAVPRDEVTQVCASSVQVFELAPGDLLTIYLDPVHHVVDDEKYVALCNCILGGLEDTRDSASILVNDKEQDPALRLGVSLELNQTLVPIINLRIVEGDTLRLEKRNGGVFAPCGGIAASPKEN